MSSRRLASLLADDLEIVGYSVAGEESVVAVPMLNVCFDIGRCPEEALLVDNVFLTHGHMDHAAGIAYYCSQRNFREMAAGTVYCSAGLKSKLQSLLDCWGRIDGNRPPANIIAVEDNKEYQIRKNLYVYVFSTNHYGDSMGFTIIERRQKLKEQYHGLASREIVDLKKQGIEITYTLDMPLVTYLGDTMAGDFENLPCVQNSKILIAECTFFEPDHHDRARAGRHYHVDSMAEFLEKSSNQYVILTHLSRRTDIRLAKKMLKSTLSKDLYSKVTFLMDRTKRGVILK
ncbi:MAG: MBL fold metallo-hydrolase [Phycisphaerae bacterium]|nr:MBL fold metallo-hydrolase [Phycisphaerae bacterium]